VEVGAHGGAAGARRDAVLPRASTADGTSAVKIIRVTNCRPPVVDPRTIETVPVVERSIEEANNAIALRLDVEAPHLPGARTLEDIGHDAADGAWLVSRAGRDLRRHGRDRIALDLNRLSAVGEVAVHRKVRIRDW